MKQRKDKGSLADMLVRLPGMDRKALVEKWRELYGFTPKPNISRQLMMRAIAYRLQENALGKLKPSTRALLEKHAEEKIRKPAKKLKPGMQIIKEWRGATYEVTLLDHGVFFDNKTYNSLTEVANLITGGKWSGPAFFGLKKAKR